VAVSAHDFTFGDLFQHRGDRGAVTGHIRDRGFLVRRIQMVKLEHPRWILPPTIDAGLPYLGIPNHFPDYFPTGRSRSLCFLDVLFLVRLIMLLAIGCLANNAIGLPATCPFCFESSQRLHNLTSGTNPFIHSVIARVKLLGAKPPHRC
jgi:hypothetical protein